MAQADPTATPRERLEAGLRQALADRDGADPADAGRVGCLLRGRAQYEAQVGASPQGSLAALPSPFEGLELPVAAREALAEIAAEPDDTGAIGDGYEATLDTPNRDAHGQYFTPEPIARALVRWALDGTGDSTEPPVVLDPAVGTGTFLVAAHDVLQSRQPGRATTARLDRLVGVDVDGVALQLAGLRLAAQAVGAAPDDLRLHHRSFFDCAPAEDSATDSTVALGTADVVVGNPPYVRAEALEPGTEHFRRHLAAFGPADEAPWSTGDDALSRRADAYVYFVTQATRFLRPGGRLAMVLPTKWLMSAYGEDLRRFLREHYRVRAVVGFGGRAFGDALVDTALLLAERYLDAEPTSPLRFVSLDGPATVDGLLSAVDAAPRGSPAVARDQRSLTASGSLARYLEAPTELLSLLDDDRLVRLDALAEVSRGTMTGANRFFFVDRECVERFGIEERFRRPAVKSLRSVERPTVDPPAIERWLLDVHSFVEAVDAELVDDRALEPAVKAAIKDAGYDGLQRYVEHAEAAGWHEGRTCQSRSVWFDLGPLGAPAAFVPKLLRERVFAVRNAAGAVPSNAIDAVWPAPAVPTGALLAALNASIGTAAMEATGRDEAGLLQLMTYETASLPTLDVRRLDHPTAERLATAGAAFAEAPDGARRRALDRAVHDAFDLPIPPDELRELATDLRRRRVEGGETVAVPVR